MSVIVYGPQGCGKSANAEVITDHFGLSSWIDNWTPGMPMPQNALLLTQAYGIPGALHYFDVMREIDRERMREVAALLYRLAELIVPDAVPGCDGLSMETQKRLSRSLFAGVDRPEPRGDEG